MPRPGLIILAAGGSTRMGRPKQLLPWGNSTLLRHACKTALATTCHPVVVVLGCEAQRCQDEIGDLAVLKVVNEKWKQGMGISVSRGIAELEQDSTCTAALLMLVDQPEVSAPFLDSLVETWQREPERIVATEYPEGGGVPGVIPRRHFPDLLSLRADEGARSVIARQRDAILIRPSFSPVDLDTPEQYQNSVAAVS